MGHTKKETPHDVSASSEEERNVNANVLEMMYNILDKKLDNVLRGLKIIVLFLILEFFMIMIYLF
ncbi:hypothetical protein GI584_14445 [Gracilibacillus salitolerans]|uniref:Uncharacterized protein n=1 Tax=Gracilibacillus salitolerans TaxID=2663022 RepID=A0A5Q2TM54_9BACI|nr:hypothetical protein [Gracilibacillus salitolerans]QGH35172.1 hypothetical protein GI584_14445 [Gracilibacillus salitolerans]